MLLKMAKYILLWLSNIPLCICVCVCIPTASWVNHLLIDISVTSMSYRSPFLIALEVNQPEFFSHKNFTDKGKLNHKRGWKDKSGLFKVFPTRVPEPEQPPTHSLDRGLDRTPFLQAGLPILAESQGPLSLKQEVCPSEHFYILMSFPLHNHSERQGIPTPAGRGRTWIWKRRGDVPRIPEWAVEPGYGW